MKKKLLSLFMAVVMCVCLMPTSVFAMNTVGKTIEVADGDSIQAAVDQIAAAADSKGWTIKVAAGTYDRFTVSKPVSDLTIVGSGDSTVINVLNDDKRTSWDNGGINVWAPNVTIQNMTISAGTSKKAWADAAISTNNGASGGEGYSLTVDSCTLQGPGIGNGALYGIFWNCDRVEVKNTSISGFSNAIEWMLDGFSIPADQTYQMVNNTITNCSFAMHGYMGGNAGPGTLEIANNTITGSDALRAKVIVQDNASKTLKANIHDNILNNVVVGTVNLQDAGDKNDVLKDNTMGDGSFYVDAIEPGSIDLYATYKAPEGKEGHWALTGIDDLEVDWGKNPDGTNAYIREKIHEANAAGSHELSLTGIDPDNLVKTFTWFKDGIYWVSGKDDKTSYPSLEKKIVDENGELKDSVSVAKGETVKFKLTSNVPQDIKNYLKPADVDGPQLMGSNPLNGGKYELTFHDVMDPQLVLNKDSVQISVNGKALAVENGQIKVADGTVVGSVANGTNAEGKTTLDATIDLVAVYNAKDAQGNPYFTEADFGTAPVVLTYTATAKNDIVAGTYYNSAWVEYEGGETEKDVVDVKTYGIDIFKYDQADPAKGLAGAEFVLKKVGADGTETQVGGTLVSGADGHIRIDGLKEGTYKLYETKAPSGYVKSDEPLTIVIPGTNVNAENIIYVKFANSNVPHTGGMGTTLFTVGGAGLIAAGAVLLVLRKKKENA